VPVSTLLCLLKSMLFGKVADFEQHHQ